MSLKDHGEDKAETVLPRSIPALRSLMNEVQAAMRSRRIGAGLVEELHTARRKLIGEMIEAGRVGAPSATIEAYSGIANESLAVYAAAQFMATGLGSGRS